MNKGEIISNSATMREWERQWSQTYEIKCKKSIALNKKCEIIAFRTIENGLIIPTSATIRGQPVRTGYEL